MDIAKENENWIIKISKQENIDDTLLFEIKFKLLAEQWYDEIKYFSFAKQRENETYFHILAMGKTIVPFIIKELNKGKNVWFNALKKLTHQNPVKEQNIGNPNLMANDWARQLENGKWTSKLGESHDITHSIYAIENGVYGNATVFLKKPT